MADVRAKLPPLGLGVKVAPGPQDLGQEQSFGMNNADEVTEEVLKHSGGEVMTERDLDAIGTWDDKFFYWVENYVAPGKFLLNVEALPLTTTTFTILASHPRLALPFAAFSSTVPNGMLHIFLLVSAAFMLIIATAFCLITNFGLPPKDPRVGKPCALGRPCGSRARTRPWP